MCVSPSLMLIWVLLSSQCSKIRMAQHWGRREHIWVRTKVHWVNARKFWENSQKAVSVSTICDNYCSICRQILINSKLIQSSTNTKLSLPLVWTTGPVNARTRGISVQDSTLKSKKGIEFFQTQISPTSTCQWDYHYPHKDEAILLLFKTLTTTHRIKPFKQPAKDNQWRKGVPGFSLWLVLTETKLRKVNKPAEDVLEKNRKEKERGPLLNSQAVLSMSTFMEKGQTNQNKFKAERNQLELPEPRSFAHYF